jgi:Ca-activated chloride channel family protein
MYEIIPAGSASGAAKADDLKYQESSLSAAASSGEMLTVKFRYKPIKSETSVPIELPVKADAKDFGQSSLNLRFASAVVEFGMLLRKSEFAGTSSWDSVIQMAKAAKGADEEGYRAEFIGMAETAKKLSPK